METQAQSCTKIIIRVTVREKNVVGQREEVTGEGKEGTSIALNRHPPWSLHNPKSQNCKVE